MEDIWRIIKKYPKTNIIVVSLIATILIINETLGFAGRLRENIFLAILSLIIFYFFVRIIIEEKIKNDKNK